MRLYRGRASGVWIGYGAAVVERRRVGAVARATLPCLLRGLVALAGEGKGWVKRVMSRYMKVVQAPFCIPIIRLLCVSTPLVRVFH